MVNVGSADCLEVGSVDAARPSADGRVLLGGCSGFAVTEDVGPLLDTLSKVVVVECGIPKWCGRMVQSSIDLMKRDLGLT